MKKYKCLLIEDEPLARELMIDYIKQINSLQLVSVCKNAIEAYEILNSVEIDLMFLDLHLPKLKGLDFLSTLNKYPKVIITTAYSEYAVKSYEFQVFDYLLKPFDFSRFFISVNKFLKLEQSNNTTDSFVFFNVNKKQVKVYFDEIEYIESQKEYIKIVCSEYTINTKYSLSNFMEKLSNNEFIRIHRSFVVNRKKIKSFTHNEVYINSQNIPIGRFYKEEALSSLYSS